MIAAIERLIGRLFAPLSRELGRLPPQAFRQLLAGF